MVRHAPTGLRRRFAGKAPTVTLVWVLIVWTSVAFVVAPLLGRFLAMNTPHDPSVFRPAFRPGLRPGAHRR
jgi:hypothetical protein